MILPGVSRPKLPLFLLVPTSSQPFYIPFQMAILTFCPNVGGLLFVLWKVRKWWTLILILIGLKAISQSDFNTKIQYAQQLIVNNCNNEAILTMDELTQNKLSQQQLIQCLDIKKNALFFNQEYAAFQETSKRIHILRGAQEKPAQQALFLAEQAFFFHYLTWQDSVALYMGACKNILTKKELKLLPEEGAFIHFMLANYQLYIGHGDDPNGDKRYRAIDDYFKMAIAYLNAPCIFHDRLLSVLYRSWGSRTLDRVSRYRALTKIEADNRPAYQKKLDALVSLRLRKAASVVPANCADDKVYALALEALMYNYLDQGEKSNQIFIECIHILQKQYTELYRSPGLKSLCLLLKYKISNDERHLGNIPDINWYIQQLRKIEPIYTAQVLSSEQFRYDTYGASPLHTLGCLLLQKGKEENKANLMKEGAMYFLENFNHRFTQSIDISTQNAIRRWTSKNELHYNLQQGEAGQESDLQRALQFSHNSKMIGHIQQQLGKHEIVMVKTWRSLMNSNYRLIIARQKIDWIKCPDAENAILDPQSEPSFSDFKTWAWTNYKSHMAPVLKVFPNTSRIYIPFNDLTDYECLIDNPSGNQYAELSYLIKKMQFNRIYNIEQYFNLPPIILEKRIDLISLVQPEYKPLHFTTDMLRNLFESSFSVLQENEENLQSAFSRKGIMHLYGHGQLKKLDFGQLQYSIPFYQKNEWKDLRNQKKKYNNCQSLVIFNTCFSGATGSIYEYDSELHTNILLQGAPAIVISAVRSEDQSSAMMFEKFYELLESGLDAESALYQAKKNYLETQLGENCNPYRWQAYRMISTQKIQPFSSLSWWEKVWNWLTNVRYLFGLPALK
jgi:hypothetical protein